MQLGADEVQPALQAVARQRAIGRCQFLVRHLVGDVLHDGRTFGQARTVVQLQQRHVAQRVDGVVVGAVVELVGLGRRTQRGEGQAGFVQCDVRGQRAGARRVIEFHARVSSEG